MTKFGRDNIVIGGGGGKRGREQTKIEEFYQNLFTVETNTSFLATELFLGETNLFAMS